MNGVCKQTTDSQRQINELCKQTVGILNGFGSIFYSLLTGLRNYMELTRS